MIMRPIDADECLEFLKNNCSEDMYLAVRAILDPCTTLEVVSKETYTEEYLARKESDNKLYEMQETIRNLKENLQCTKHKATDIEGYRWWNNAIDNCTHELEKLLNEETCETCNKRDNENHYCPEWCRVIRETHKEMTESYKGEHEKLEKIQNMLDNDWDNGYQSYETVARIKKVMEEE